MFSKSVVQVVIIFGDEKWVITPRIVRALGGVQHRDIGRQPQRLLDGSWDYPHLETLMQEAGFEDVELYVLKRQNTVVQYISM